MPAPVPPPLVAVILPHAYLGGTLRLWLNVVRHVAARHGGRVVAGVPADHRSTVAADLAALAAELPGAEIRGYRWRRLGPHEARDAAAGVRVARWISDEYQLPVDGGPDFLDCPFWLFVSDRLERPLPPVRPYGIFVTDHLQRYVPEIFDTAAYADAASAIWNFLRVVRNADLVVATSRDTARDAGRYAGALGRIVRLPTTLDVDHFLSLARAAPATGAARDTLVWVTNASPHKNHLRMLEALRHYYDVLGGGLDAVVTGVGTECFDPALDEPRRSAAAATWHHPHVRRVRDLLTGPCAGIRARIHFRGAVSDAEYVRLVAGARYLAHNVLADNGTFSVVEAALVATPSVSSDYPQMREIDEAFGLGLRFFDAFDAVATARVLREAEALPPELPPDVLDRIRARSWRSWDGSLTAAIAEVVAAGRGEVACL